MKKLLLSLAIIVVSTGASFAQQRTWNTFVHPRAEWSILAPGVLVSETDPGKPTSKIVGYDYKDKTGFFAVIYRGVSKVPKNPKDYFDKTRDDAVKAVGGRLTKDAEFTNGGVTGREIHIQMEYGRVERARIFFHGKRIYTVLAILPAEQVSGDEINAFFNSFSGK